MMMMMQRLTSGGEEKNKWRHNNAKDLDDDVNDDARTDWKMEF